jgi:hypothetical protein
VTFVKGDRVIVATTLLGDQPGTIGNADPQHAYVMLDHGGGNTWTLDKIRPEEQQ